MSKKITISVPDCIYERLQEYRDKICFSSICLKALVFAMDSVDLLLKNNKLYNFVSNMSKEDRNNLSKVLTAEDE